MTNEGKELVTKNATGLPAIPDPASLKEIFEANFEGVQPSFEVIKIPTGGMTVWSVPGEEGEADVVKELSGVILDHYAVRGYWEKRYGDGGTIPPTCFSLDGRTGSLERNAKGEFGECATCRWAEWGTAVKQDGAPGRGQACRLRHRVYLLMPERSIFPFLIPLSVMSATKKYEGSFSTYVVKLGGKLKKVFEVRSKLKLIKDTNADGVEYAKAQFFFSGDLTEEEAKRVAFLRGALRPAMRSRPFEIDEAEDEPEKPEGPRGAEREANAGPDPWEK